MTQPGDLQNHESSDSKEDGIHETNTREPTGSQSASDGQVDEPVIPVAPKDISPEIVSSYSEMDVHAHDLHKAPGQGLKHYVFEFVMLFLAVFCGFLAENFREHMVEHQREKDYMKSLVEDLTQDIADLQNDIPFWDAQLKRIDDMRTEIEKPATQRNDVQIYNTSIYLRYYNIFLYHDRTINQLKYGGNFRVIRNKSITDSLTDYDAAIVSMLRDMEKQSNDLYQHLNQLQNKLFNSKYYALQDQPSKLDSVYKRTPEIIRIRNGEDRDLFEYYNLLNYYWGMTYNRNTLNKLLKARAEKLQLMIRKAYRLS